MYKVHLNSQKLDSLSSAAVLADEYVLTHKSTFQSVLTKSICVKRVAENKTMLTTTKDDKECCYCYKTGHNIANCLALKRKEQNSSQTKPKGVGLIKSKPHVLGKDELDCTPDPCFKPFCWVG